MIPDNVIDDIRERTDIVDVIGGVLDLKRAGRNFKALCPFHGEKTPSFMVSPDKQIYHCFGCGKGGNVYSFLMEYEGVGFVEAVKELAGPLNVDVGRYLTGSEDRSRFDPYYRAMEFAQLHFRKGLEESSEASEYLDRRGFGSELVEKYRIGFAGPSWESLYKAASETDIKKDTLLEMGLIMRSRGSTGYRDYFRNRIMFPIHSLPGRVVGFAGRVLDSSEPKYLNSMDNPIYHKGKILYGLNQTKDDIRKSRTAVIVEGYVDHLMLWDSGITNICAVCGTSLTEDQARLLARYAKRIYIINDGDRAGVRAAVRAADQLVIEGLDTSIVVLPEKEDPDSFIRKEGVEALRELMSSAPDYFNYLHGEVRKGSRTAARKQQVVEHLLATVSRVEDGVRREILLQEVSSLFEIPVATLKSSLKPGKRRKSPAEGPVRHTVTKREENQKVMFRIALTSADLAAMVADNLIEEDLEGESYRKLLKALKEAIENGVDPAGPRFIGSISDPELSTLAAEITLAEPPPGPAHEILHDTLLWIKKAALKVEMAEMKERLTQLEEEGSDETSSERMGIVSAYIEIERELGKLEIKEDSQS
jgi:DNA primase